MSDPLTVEIDELKAEIRENKAKLEIRGNEAIPEAERPAFQQRIANDTALLTSLVGSRERQEIHQQQQQQQPAGKYIIPYSRRRKVFCWETSLTCHIF
jgi:hypothetical protein